MMSMNEKRLLYMQNALETMLSMCVCVSSIEYFTIATQYSLNAYSHYVHIICNADKSTMYVYHMHGKRSHSFAQNFLF